MFFKKWIKLNSEINIVHALKTIMSKCGRNILKRNRERILRRKFKKWMKLNSEINIVHALKKSCTIFFYFSNSLRILI
jgi:hypothetical protein